MPSSLPKKSNGDIPLGSAPGANNSSFSFQRGSPLSASQLNQISDQTARANAFNMSQMGLQFPTFSAPSEQFAPRMFFEGILTEDMRASTDPLTDPVVVKMKLLQPTNHVDSTDQAAVSFDDYGDEINITNRSTVLTGSEGDYIACARVNNEVRPIPGGASSSAEIVYFRILYFCYGFDASMGCACYEAEVTRTLCTSSVQVGDIITLRDPDRCWLNLPADLLFGRKGKATLFRTMDDRGGTHCTGALRSRPTEDCIWIVDYLCCVEEDYAAV